MYHNFLPRFNFFNHINENVNLHESTVRLLFKQLFNNYFIQTVQCNSTGVNFVNSKAKDLLISDIDSSEF